MLAAQQQVEGACQAIDAQIQAFRGQLFAALKAGTQPDTSLSVSVTAAQAAYATLKTAQAAAATPPPAAAAA